MEVVIQVKKIMLNQDLQSQLLKAGYRGKFELSELIEACGGSFEYLKRYKADGVWEAGGLNGEGEGSTPEIAVSNLWLSLNKK